MKGGCIEGLATCAKRQLSLFTHRAQSFPCTAPRVGGLTIGTPLNMSKTTISVEDFLINTKSFPTESLIWECRVLPIIIIANIQAGLTNVKIAILSSDHHVAKTRRTVSYCMGAEIRQTVRIVTT